MLGRSRHSLMAGIGNISIRQSKTFQIGTREDAMRTLDFPNDAGSVKIRLLIPYNTTSVAVVLCTTLPTVAVIVTLNVPEGVGA